MSFNRHLNFRRVLEYWNDLFKFREVLVKSVPFNLTASGWFEIHWNGYLAGALMIFAYLWHDSVSECCGSVTIALRFFQILATVFYRKGGYFGLPFGNGLKVTPPRFLLLCAPIFSLVIRWFDPCIRRSGASAPAAKCRFRQIFGWAFAVFARRDAFIRPW